MTAESASQNSLSVQMVRWLTRLEAALAIGLLSFIIVVNTTQVTWRTVLNDPLSWTEEAVRVAFIWVVYVGVIMAVRKRTHISVDFFVFLLPKRLQVWSARLNHLLYIAFFGTVFVQAIYLTMHTANMTLAVLPLPAAVIYVAGVLCGALSVLHLILQVTTPIPVSRL